MIASMGPFAPSRRLWATRAVRRCPPGLPRHEVLALVVLIPHASRLRYFALDASIDEAALVDPVEHRAHRWRGHPVVVPEHDLATLGRHLEPTVVPLFRVDDRRALGEGRQRYRLRELLEHGRKSAHRPREKLANVAVTPVAEFRLDDFEELRARLDRKPRVIRELVRVDRPRSDRLGHDAATASLAQALEESHDARAPDLRYEAFLRGFPDGRGDVAPRPVQFAEEGRPVRRGAVQPAAGLDVRRKAFDEPAIRELAQRAAHVHDPEGRLLGELARHLRFRGQGRQHLLAVAARHHEAEVQPDMASRLHWQLARSGTI